MQALKEEHAPRPHDAARFWADPLSTFCSCVPEIRIATRARVVHAKGRYTYRIGWRLMFSEHCPIVLAMQRIAT
jgi:hypothetical protein